MLHRAGEPELVKLLPLDAVHRPPAAVRDDLPQMTCPGPPLLPIAAQLTIGTSRRCDNRPTTAAGAAATWSGTNPSHGNVHSCPPARIEDTAGADRSDRETGVSGIVHWVGHRVEPHQTDAVAWLDQLHEQLG
jgi:hypothetical protein